MKTSLSYLYILFMILCSSAAIGQTVTAKSLVEEGIKFHDDGKYADAINKFKEALKLEPENKTAAYELSYTLYTSNNSAEAIPYLKKLIKSPSSATAAACDLLGSIYDDDDKGGKAIETYKTGLKAEPTYQRLHYNIGVSYLRQHDPKNALAYAVSGLKLQPDHAGSHWLYARASQDLNSGTEAVFAYCRFLMLEPQTERSAGAFKNLQKIIQSKAVKTGDKSVTIYVTEQKGGDKDIEALDMMFSISAAASLEVNKGKSPLDALSNQLQHLFAAAGELSLKKKVKTFFWNNYADYFFKLAKSPNVPAFTRLISLTAYKDENLRWFNENDKAVTDLDNWIKLNEPGEEVK